MVEGVRREIRTIEELREVYEAVMTAINTAINAHVPFAKPCPHQKM